MMFLIGNTQTMKPAGESRYSLRRREAVTGWLFVMPALLGFAVFTFGSILYSFYISLTKWELLTSPEFIGFRNYMKLFADPKFYKFTGNTLYFVVWLVPLVLVISMALAILINRKTKLLTNIYRSSLFLPCITSTVAISLVWMWILNPDTGIINNILRAFGVIDPPRWLESTVWAKPALVVMRVWQMSGYYMIMFLAGLQVIPENLYEAAEVDGATHWQKTIKITIPMLANTTFVVAIMLVIEAFNIFEAIFVMTEGGPIGSTTTLMYYIYDLGFKRYNMGYASAVAWVFFAMILVVTMIQYALRKEQKM
jgi:multiple sugar transport system permease protein